MIRGQQTFRNRVVVTRGRGLRHKRGSSSPGNQGQQARYQANNLTGEIFHVFDSLIGQEQWQTVYHHCPDTPNQT